MEDKLTELLSEIKELLEMQNSSSKKDFNEMLNKALENDCKITIQKRENDATRVSIEGNRLTLLLVLAGAEKNILEELDCDKEEFDFLKEIVGTDELGAELEGK